MKKVRVSTVCVMLITLFSAVSAQDRPKNLKVFPDTIDGERLTDIMKGFTSALGVRCSFCHVGEEGRPLSEYDFASDARKEKNIAREMLRMTSTVNATITGIFRSDNGAPVSVQCVTCHRGVREPKTIDDVLWEEYRTGGADGAMQWFRDARKKFYGGISYDFSERTLIQFARRLDQQPDSAVKVMEVNREYFPDSSPTLTVLASLYITTHRADQAALLLETVLKNDPGNERAKRMLERIRKQ